MIRKRIGVIAVMILMTILTSACGVKTIEEGSVGLLFNKGVLTEVLPPGYHTYGLWKEVDVVNVSSVNLTFTNDSVITNDRKPVSVVISANVARDTGSLMRVYSLQRIVVNSDTELIREANERLAEVAKVAVSEFDFWDIVVSDASEGLSGREELKARIKEALDDSLATVGASVIDIQVQDVSPSGEFADQVNSNAILELQKQAAEQRLEVLEAQRLAQEKEAELSQIQAGVYRSSPELLQLEMMKMMTEAWKQAGAIFVMSSDVQSPIILGDGNE